MLRNITSGELSEWMAYVTIENTPDYKEPEQGQKDIKANVLNVFGKLNLKKG